MLESVLDDNKKNSELAQKHKVNKILIDNRYEVDVDL